jgi:hypothetical protein
MQYAITISTIDDLEHAMVSSSFTSSLAPGITFDDLTMMQQSCGVVLVLFANPEPRGYQNVSQQVAFQVQNLRRRGIHTSLTALIPWRLLASLNIPITS